MYIKQNISIFLLCKKAPFHDVDICASKTVKCHSVLDNAPNGEKRTYLDSLITLKTMSGGCFQMILFALWPCMNCEGLFFVVTLMNLRVRRRIFPLRKIRFFKCPKEYYINYQECKSEILLRELM